MTLIIRKGRLLDPASGTDRQVDVRIDGETVAELAEPGSLKGGDALASVSPVVKDNGEGEEGEPAAAGAMDEGAEPPTEDEG